MGDGYKFVKDSWLLISGNNGEISLCNATTGGTVLTIHDGFPVKAFALSPNGNVLATGDSTGRVVFWSTNTGQMIASYTVPDSSSITSLSFSSDGKTLVTGDLDGQLVEVSGSLWNLPFPKLQGLLCKEVHRNLSRAEQLTYLQGLPNQPACP